MISDDQIRLLEIEAGQVGDLRQVSLCTRALRGDRRARRECERVVREARARAGERGDS